MENNQEKWDEECNRLTKKGLPPNLAAAIATKHHGKNKKYKAETDVVTHERKGTSGVRHHKRRLN